jgi:putative zinc finger/helix-turn-helix YgiT family protein
LSCGKALKPVRENHRYVESGLPNVTLVKVEVRRCPHCGEEELVIPKIEQLHRVLAGAVAMKTERLTHHEIRFLRKYLGWSGADFAAHFGVVPETVSRWESGHQVMNPTAEKLLRILALRLEPIKDYSILKSWSLGEPIDRNYRLEWTDSWVAVAA